MVNSDGCGVRGQFGFDADDLRLRCGWSNGGIRTLPVRATTGHRLGVIAARIRNDSPRPDEGVESTDRVERTADREGADRLQALGFELQRTVLITPRRRPPGSPDDRPANPSGRNADRRIPLWLTVGTRLPMAGVGGRVGP